MKKILLLIIVLFALTSCEEMLNYNTKGTLRFAQDNLIAIQVGDEYLQMNLDNIEQGILPPVDKTDLYLQDWINAEARFDWDGQKDANGYAINIEKIQLVNKAGPEFEFNIESEKNIYSGNDYELNIEKHVESPMIKVTFYNHTDNPIEIGADLLIEKEVNGKWMTQRITREFILIGYTVPAQNSRYDISTLDFFLPFNMLEEASGKYRVLKHLEGDQFISKEFNIEDIK